MDTYLVMMLVTAEQEHAIRCLFQQRGWKFYKTGSRPPVKEELQLLYENSLSQKAPDNLFRNLQPYVQLGSYIEQQQFGTMQNLMRTAMNILPYNVHDINRSTANPLFHSADSLSFSPATNLESTIERSTAMSVGGHDLVTSLSDSNSEELTGIRSVDKHEVNHKRYSNNDSEVASHNVMIHLSDVNAQDITHLGNKTYSHLQTPVTDSQMNSGFTSYENKIAFHNLASTVNRDSSNQSSEINRMFGENIDEINTFGSESRQKNRNDGTLVEHVNTSGLNEMPIVDFTQRHEANRPAGEHIPNITAHCSIDESRLQHEITHREVPDTAATESSEPFKDGDIAMTENIPKSKQQHEGNIDCHYKQDSAKTTQDSVQESASKIIASYIMEELLVPAEQNLIVENVELKIKEIIGSFLENKNTDAYCKEMEDDYSEMEDKDTYFNNLEPRIEKKVGNLSEQKENGNEQEHVLVKIKLEKEMADPICKKSKTSKQSRTNKIIKKKLCVKKNKKLKLKEETLLRKIDEVKASGDQIDNNNVEVDIENKRSSKRSRGKKPRIPNQRKKRARKVKEIIVVKVENVDDIFDSGENAAMAEPGDDSLSKHRWSISRNIRMHGFHKKCNETPPDLDSENYSQSWKGYFCADCNFIFKGKNKMTLHKSLKGGHCSPDCIYCDKDEFKDIYECSKCPKCFKTKELLEKHEERHRGDAFRCQYCESGFYTVVDLKLHIQAEHSQETQESHLCDLCGSKFAEKKVMVAHRKYVHTNERPEECPTCGRRFKTKSQLKNHLVVHKTLTDLNLSCEVCGKMFMRAATLRDHVRRHKKEFSTFCKVCGKGFYRMSGLDEHMRIHTGVKPFECKVCGYKCALSCNLKKHLRIHTKPWQ